MEGCTKCQILKYGTYFELPRGMYVQVNNFVVSLLCDFDEVLNEYNDHFVVNLVIDVSPQNIIAGNFNWGESQKQYLGVLSLNEITFEANRGMSIMSQKLIEMINSM